MDLNDYYLNTQYPIDTLVFLWEGSNSVPNGTYDALPVLFTSHGLPFTPLPMIVWSNTPDFAISNTLIDSQRAGTFYTTFSGQQYLVYATSENIVIQRENSSGSNQTVYFRVYCFPPSDAPDDSIVPFTVDDGDSFALNTMYNYLKLGNIGKLTSGSNFYTHNLGYIPRVFSWGIGGGFATPVVSQQIISNDPTGSVGATSGIYIDATELRWLNPNSFDEIEYRIYRDS